MSALVEAGWIAPEQAGPTRRRSITAMVIAVAALALWATVATGLSAGMFGGGSGPASVTLRVGEDGRLSPSSSGAAEVRSSGRSKFLVLQRDIVAGGDTLTVRVVTAEAIEPSVAVLRIDAPGARVRVRRTAGGDPVATVDPAHGREVRAIVTLPVRALPRPRGGRPVGRLRALTDPLDDRIARNREETDRLQSLGAAWWWLLPLGLIPVAATLWLWRRAARRFRSMRVPGPGQAATTAPPSSLDPVGVATVVAGAHSIDLADAFAGHVLDLVERRQLRMRRTLDPEHGAGALLGLAQVEEEGLGLTDDPAVALLRSVTLEDGFTVALPDAVSRRPLPDADMRRGWAVHVAARARFERLVERAARGRVGIAAGVAALVGAAGVVGVFVIDGVGSRALALFVAAVALPLAGTTGAWWIDAGRWRLVGRTRRTERAQWLAWGHEAIDGVNPASDIRNAPLLVASGQDGGVPQSAGVDAVGLRAVTSATLATLRALAVPGH